MLPRNIRFVLLGFALLLTAVLLTSKFPQSRIFQALSYSLSRSNELANEDLDTLAIALGRYHTTTRTYPTTTEGLAALVEGPAAAPPASWAPKLEAIPLDPWDRPYVYELLDVSEDPRDRLNLYSLGPDGIESEDDLTSEIDL